MRKLVITGVRTILLNGALSVIFAFVLNGILKLFGYEPFFTVGTLIAYSLGSAFWSLWLPLLKYYRAREIVKVQ